MSELLNIVESPENVTATVLLDEGLASATGTRRVATLIVTGNGAVCSMSPANIDGVPEVHEEEWSPSAQFDTLEEVLANPVAVVDHLVSEADYARRQNDDVFKSYRICSPEDDTYFMSSADELVPEAEVARYNYEHADAPWTHRMCMNSMSTEYASWLGYYSEVHEQRWDFETTLETILDQCTPDAITYILDEIQYLDYDRVEALRARYGLPATD